MLSTGTYQEAEHSTRHFGANVVLCHTLYSQVYVENTGPLVFPRIPKEIKSLWLDASGEN